MNRFRLMILFLCLSLCLSMTACQWRISGQSGTAETVSELSLEEIPDFSGTPYVVLEDNCPDFSEEELTTVSFETYRPLDSLGRCGAAYANIGTDLMPDEERGDIGQVEPSGWHSVEYDCVDGGYLYNRCHLIGYQLSGENANEENLITGTRYFNVEGMLPFEEMVADYVTETSHHVLYRVTPIYEGDNLVASGVRMEALSVEDGGEGVCFDVYVYNCQPGVSIDYATGESCLASSESSEHTERQEYVLNTRSKKFHLPDCSGVETMSASNRENYTGSRDDLIADGYTPCGLCQP
ncbi:MAG TPA: DNA/RNA non-specific endonuclease [Candidatus Onthomonas avicola]|nr:DNA/RNA non-specific endonuclease [Candidatus Onthomonas avicola]